MPLPAPRGKEYKNHFISRCMRDPTMNREFPKHSQRLAVCQSRWRVAKEKK